MIRYAQEQGAKILLRGQWKYEIGLGIRAEIDGEMTLVGSDRFMIQEGIDLEPIHQKYPHLRLGSCSIIYVATEGKLIDNFRLN